MRWTHAQLAAFTVSCTLAACTPPSASTTSPATLPGGNPAASQAATRVATRPAKVDPTIALFTSGRVPFITFHISPVAEQSLRTSPRKYVDGLYAEGDAAAPPAAARRPATTSAPARAPAATASAPGTAPAPPVYKKVEIKLKGSIGSFRPYDERAGFTLKFGKKDGEFHGLEKVHLNNSVQDESYCNEYIGHMIFAAAGYPAGRVAHARVIVNGRDLGLYLIKESIDADFLKRHFPRNSTGNLYENLSVRDIDTPLPKAEGAGPDDYSDLQALLAACREPDEKKRFAAIAERLDVDMFLTYTALEQMVGHWDGYNFNRNNFHLYFRPSDGRAVFIPNGMDQLFRDPNASVLATPPSILGSAVFSNPEWKARYVERVRSLLPLFEADRLTGAVDALHTRMRPLVSRLTDERSSRYEDRVANFRGRVSLRGKGILAQLPPAPRPAATATSAPAK